MNSNSATITSIGLRLERMPVTKTTWNLIFLLSIGAFFEIYDIFLTAYLSPGLIRSGIFSTQSHELFGLSDQATFAASTFAGLFVGTILFSSAADKFGRRSIFTWSLLWYTAATIVMAMQSTAIHIFIWRFIAGIGIGVELVTIDAYIAEFVPRQIRVRAFAFNTFVQFLAIPTAALLAWIFIPLDLFGIAGWRIIALISALGAIVVWYIRKNVPESPRWLASQGRFKEAEVVLYKLEQKARVQASDTIYTTPIEDPKHFIMKPSIKVRIGIMIIFQFFQTIGFYGFGNWLPALLAANGLTIVHSLKYSFAIALAYPISPLISFLWADKFEAKWQIVFSALGIAFFGLVFSQQTNPLLTIVFGILVTFSNCSLSYSYHAYQTELFPTSIRAKTVGFCYSWSRFSTILSSYMIAFCLQHFGTLGVFTFIALSMIVVMTVIGFFGPRTRNHSLEELSS